jgi:hypothetical protein
VAFRLALAPSGHAQRDLSHDPSDCTLSGGAFEPKWCDESALHRRTGTAADGAEPA